MKRLLTIQLMILAVFVLLGNGIRSIGMSTVSMSQAEFASFLNISAERTDMLIEASMGGALLALALAPFLISLGKATQIVGIAAALAVVCYSAIGLTMHLNPALLSREIIVIAAFAFGGFAVAFFAPLAQLAIGQVEDERGRSALTTIWTAALPLTLLATPMLVKYVAFDIGVGNFFFILAALPLVFIAIVPVAFPASQRKHSVKPVAISWKRLVVLILMLTLFQVSTVSVSLAGIDHAVTLVLMAATILTGAWLFLQRHRWLDKGREWPASAATLIALLFVLQIPSTGVFDAAYLVRHLCSASFIADRAMFGAVAQIAGVFGAGALLLRWPRTRDWLIWLSLVLVFLGSAMMMMYPYRPSDIVLFIVSKMVLSGGVGVGTTVLVRSILMVAGDNKIVVMAPAFVILLGTEVGMELLQIVFQTTQLLGYDTNVAFANVLLLQVVAPVIAMIIMFRSGLSRAILLPVPV